MSLIPMRVYWTSYDKFFKSYQNPKNQPFLAKMAFLGASNSQNISTKVLVVYIVKVDIP